MGASLPVPFTASAQAASAVWPRTPPILPSVATCSSYTSQGQRRAVSFSELCPTLHPSTPLTGGRHSSTLGGHGATCCSAAILFPEERRREKKEVAKESASFPSHCVLGPHDRPTGRTSYLLKAFQFIVLRSFLSMELWNYHGNFLTSK